MVGRFVKNFLRPFRKFSSNFVSIVNENSIVRKAAWILAAEKVEGDYLEFGVYDGGSIIQAQHEMEEAFREQMTEGGGRTREAANEIREIWSKMRFFAFDSFQGLPEIEGIDAKGSDFEEGTWSYNEEGFRRNLSKSGFTMSSLVTVPGWFEETCNEQTKLEHNMKKAAVVHIDCDLYSSTKTVLTFIESLLVDGTVIIFDDWYNFKGNPNLGEQRAFAEWSEDMTDWAFVQYQKEGPWRNSFIASFQGN